MTFRTTDIDLGHAALNTEANNPVRDARSRRRARVLSHRTSGFRIAGLGI